MINLNSKLKNYLVSLKLKNMSANSMRGYKSDINQFLNWAHRNDLPASFSSFKKYQLFLKSKYLISSVKRKSSSVSQFLEYCFGKQEKAPKSSKSKVFKRNALFLGAYTFMLILIVSSIPFYANAPDVSNPTVLPENKHLSSSQKDLSNISSTNNIKVVVSAPQNVNTNLVPQVIAADNNYELVGNYADGLSTRTAGSATIPAGQLNTTIYSDFVTSDSIILITLKTSLQNQNAYVQKQGDGFFAIAVDIAIDNNIGFNWFIN